MIEMIKLQQKAGGSGAMPSADAHGSLVDLQSAVFSI
jgi:hypothetical protein